MLRAAATALTLVALTGAAALAAGPESAPGYRSLAFAAPVPGTYALPPLGNAADGALLDDRGSPVRLHDLLDGKIALLSFVYTTCRDTNGCPLASFVLGSVQTRLLERPELANSLRLITVSFDPGNDPPARMHTYGQRLRKPPVDWRFLTARSEADLAPILAEYGQTVRKDFGADGTYLGTFSHVLRVYLIDRDRRIRNVYSTSFLHADTLLADVETLAREAPAASPARAGPKPAGSPTGEGFAHARATPSSLGLPPAGQPATPEQVALGRKLFFDRRLSANETFSCAMCHVPSQGFTSNEMATAVGIEGRTVKRNAPTLYNVGYASVLFHDGRAPTLEEQAWGPLLAHNEMGNASDAQVVAKIRALTDYDRLFEGAYGGEPSRDRIGAALASYERTLVAGTSPFDRWRFGGDPTALSDEAKHGFELFMTSAGCAQCHTIAQDHALFTDYGFHDTGIARRSARIATRRTLTFAIAPGVTIASDPAFIADAAEAPPHDEGRFEITGLAADRDKFRTPTLRNVALTAPYMHDGSLPTLDAVVRYYDAGGEPRDGGDARIHPLHLTEREVAALVAFLLSLTGDTRAVLTDAMSADIGSPKN